MKKSIFALLTAFIIFIALVGLAIRYQSANVLYAASALPILIVLFVPDIKSNQYIKPRKHKSLVELYRTGGDAEPELLVIAFRPGYIHWNKHIVYFQPNDAPVAGAKPDLHLTATFPVLAYDLLRHRRKPGWIGIRLAHLRERSGSLSYTIDEANRFVIRMEDIRALAKPSQAVHTAAGTKAQL